jgi:hypothetical protein
MIDRAGLLKDALRGVMAPAGAMLTVAGVAFSFAAAETALKYRGAAGAAAPQDLNNAIVFGILGAVLFVAGLLTARGPARRVMDLMRLAGHGAAGTATVTSAFETSTAVKGVPFWRLRYRYRDAAGAEHEGESDLLTPKEAAEWRSGASGPILYDAARPATSAWLGRHAELDPAAPGPGARMWARLMRLARFVIWIAVVLAAIFVAGVIGELVPPLKALEAWMTAQRVPLMYGIGGMTLLGVLVMLGGIMAVIRARGDARRLDHTGVENVARSVSDAQRGPRFRRASTYRIRGWTWGAAGDDEYSFRELKEAFASGAILREKLWRRRLVAMLGAALLFFGVFGAAIVYTPLALKILLFAAVVYAVVRITWGLIRA